MNRDDNVVYERTGIVARVRMNRAQYHNAQSAQLLEDIDAAFAEASADPEVRVIILSGNGDSFSSGHDLGTPQRQAEIARQPQGVTKVELQCEFSLSHFLEMSLRWRDLPKPTIAQVHGWCIFGGWLIASAMDLIVASEDARFLTSLVQYFPLPYDIGARRAKELVLDPRELSATQALEWGFVNRVVPKDQLEEETTALAERIGDQSPFWLRMAKASVNGAQDAAGFRTAVRLANTQHMLAQLEEVERRREEAAAAGLTELPQPRRRPTVERVLGKRE